MGREYLITGSDIQASKDSVVLRGKRSQSGPEIELRVPVGTLLSLAMHARRAQQGHQAMTTEQLATNQWKLVHPLPIQVAQVHPTADQTMGACLVVLDPDTDVELQLSFPTVEFVRQLGEALIAAADQAPSPAVKN